MSAKTFTYIPPHAHTQHRSTHNTPQKSPAPPEAGRRVTKHSKPCSKHAPTSKRAVRYYGYIPFSFRLLPSCLSALSQSLAIAPIDRSVSRRRRRRCRRA